MSSSKPEAESIADQIKATHPVAQSYEQDLETKEFIVLSEGLRVEDLQEFHDHPRLITQTVAARSLPSMKELWERFSTPASSVMLYDNAVPIFKAVFDYHMPATPMWGYNRAVFRLTPTEDWNRWLENVDRAMTHRDAMKLFDRMVHTIHKPPEDALAPTASDFITLIEKLTVRRNVEFTSVQRVDGGAAVEFTENKEGAAKDNAKIPTSFYCRLKPFVEFDYTIQFRVQLRSKVNNDNELSLTYWIEDLETISAYIDQQHLKLMTEAIGDDALILEGNLA